MRKDTFSINRRYNETSRSGSGKRGNVDIPASTTLNYPVYGTTDTSTTPGFGITMGSAVSIAHRGFEVFNRYGNIIFYDPADGGPITANGVDWRVYYQYGDSNYGSISGAQNTTLTAPYIELPDAGSGSGRGRQYGGSGVPGTANISTTGGQSSQVGDFYWRVRGAGSPQVLYVCTVAGTPGTWVQVI